MSNSSYIYKKLPSRHSRYIFSRGTPIFDELTMTDDVSEQECIFETYENITIESEYVNRNYTILNNSFTITNINYNNDSSLYWYHGAIKGSWGEQLFAGSLRYYYSNWDFLLPPIRFKVTGLKDSGLTMYFILSNTYSNRNRTEENTKILKTITDDGVVEVPKMTATELASIFDVDSMTTIYYDISFDYPIDSNATETQMSVSINIDILCNDVALRNNLAMTTIRYDLSTNSVTPSSYTPLKCENFPLPNTKDGFTVFALMGCDFSFHSGNNSLGLTLEVPTKFTVNSTDSNYTLNHYVCNEDVNYETTERITEEDTIVTMYKYAFAFPIKNVHYNDGYYNFFPLTSSLRMYNADNLYYNYLYDDEEIYETAKIYSFVGNNNTPNSYTIRNPYYGHYNDQVNYTEESTLGEGYNGGLSYMVNVLSFLTNSDDYSANGYMTFDNSAKVAVMTGAASTDVGDIYYGYSEQFDMSSFGGEEDNTGILYWGFMHKPEITMSTNDNYQTVSNSVEGSAGFGTITAVMIFNRYMTYKEGEEIATKYIYSYHEPMTLQDNF